MPRIMAEGFLPLATQAKQEIWHWETMPDAGSI
jgi:hypothetical protein